jgi:hypothetical protein
MQTFLPYPDYQLSAKSLDMRRLGKQRVEGMQILNSLVVGGGWANHPATKMWRGHEGALAEYTIAICDEWRKRGYQDSVRDKIIALKDAHPEWASTHPPWFGNREFHLSHQSALVRKDPEFYSPQFPGIGGDLAYFWPDGG